MYLPDRPAVRERLIACDEAALSITYGIDGKPPFDCRTYVSSVQLLPLTDREATVVEWSAKFDADEADEADVSAVIRALYQRFIAHLAASGVSSS